MRGGGGFCVYVRTGHGNTGQLWMGHSFVMIHYSTEAVKRDLSTYISRSRAIIKSDESLCLLCVQCLEVCQISLIVFW